jgi:hypothetical protein
MGGGGGIHEPGWRGSVHVGYGAAVVAAAEEEEEEEEDEDGESDEEGEGEVGCCCVGGGGRRRRRRRGRGRVRRMVGRFWGIWVDPKASAIRRVVDVWWSRWATLVLLPAFLVCCPFVYLVQGRTEPVWVQKR